MSIKISVVAFLGSESLKLHPMPMGILQLSEIDLLYFNKIPICLASSSDHLGSIFKKTFNYFFIYMGRQNYHKVRFSIMDKHDFLPTSPA